MKYTILFFFVATTLLTTFAQENGKIDGELISNLSFRNVGPAFTSGRISDIAVHPDNTNEWYLAMGSGNAFKTSNHGITFEPIFENYGAYSVACITVSPSNKNTLWLGTGENNNQRAIGYGDGVYKSLDGGKTWKNMGLKASEHIGNIIIHPTNENIVWVASYGPLWSEGGDRGVYMTTDGGNTWNKTLDISKHTGISEIKIDPTDPNILYAAAHQRRRHVFTYIGGGPESGIYKSTDGGRTWRTIENGLPSGDMGRIGLAVSPADPNFIYAIVEGRYDKGGTYLSTNKGESWSKQSSHSTSGNYYQEIVCDPLNKYKIFSMDTWLHHSEDGGKTFQPTGESDKHVDNHCIWINPNNTDHFIVGCDGGLYETYNHAKEWLFYPNLPVTQFYKVTVDNDAPFYNIYGGTQDNNSMGGPSATLNTAGIVNADWFITNGGDGFESEVDPVDPNIVYAQAQYGWLVRYDKKSGEKIGIQPMPGKGEAAYRWNWDAPLLISPHDHNTLYFAANKVFKSIDRGNTWQVISPDLTQQIDRNKIPVMEQVWSMDAVMKNKSTTIYGNIVAMDESSVKKGLLYIGTDDGVIQITEDDGKTWRKIGAFPGIPKDTYVNMIRASRFDENVVYAVFNNHKRGDFKPYILMSKDKGKTWTSISSNLPERGSAFCLIQDFIEKDLLFVGTEFGVFTSIDHGKNWTQLKNGLPTIPVRDMDIQEREHDLVLATFGRGFYVLDNYSSLRELKKIASNSSHHLFSIKAAKLFVPSSPLGGRGNASQGAQYYAAKNPDFGATFALYLNADFKSLKSERQKKEKEREKKGEANYYPSYEDLRKEKDQGENMIIWSIKDANGAEVHRATSSAKKGTQTYTWNLRLAGTSPVRLQKKAVGRYAQPDNGALVPAGTYTLSVYLLNEQNELVALEKNQPFEVNLLPVHSTPAEQPTEVLAFHNSLLELNRKVTGSAKLIDEYQDKLRYLEAILLNYPNADLSLLKQHREYEQALQLVYREMNGDDILPALEIETPPSLSDRLSTIKWQRYGTTSAPTETQIEGLAICTEEYGNLRPRLDKIIADINSLEKIMIDAGIPFTPHKDENWKKD